ncbi:hypothetical protein FIBSPDRAFT_1044859 [Athelia psychrophila]|uniref:Uncharacterized protein n=1 Tax=Athelia psychrophila TaxID=1759441 RepID=A0A166J1Y8_9AGAM|nr:hypothetical protein FIBSPDRAFT_1044859 [Fibularhizoctonia sp. CBS 109695]
MRERGRLCGRAASAQGRQTLCEILHSEDACLSPLSPAWNSKMVLVSEDSALLGSSPNSTLAHRRSRGSFVADRGQSYRQLDAVVDSDGRDLATKAPEGDEVVLPISASTQVDLAKKHKRGPPLPALHHPNIAHLGLKVHARSLLLESGLSQTL